MSVIRSFRVEDQPYLLRPVYQAYLKRMSDSPEILSPTDFIMLPYNIRLALGGAKIMLKNAFKTRHLNVVCCRGPINELCLDGGEIQVPRLQLSDYAKHNLDSEEVYLIGKDNLPYKLFSFEYKVVFE